MTLKICVSITANTLQELETMVSKAEKERANLLEIRLDYLDGANHLKEIRGLTNLPLIATNRLPLEGGLYKGREDRRIDSLLNAAANGFEFIDIELVTSSVGAVVKKIKETEAKLIISRHDFASTPDITMLNKTFRKEISRGADICKIVTTATKARDNLTCLQFVAEASQRNGLICFAMGKLGLPSRLLSPAFGGFLTYASIEEGKESAQGQITVAETRKFYELMKYDC